MTLQQQANLSRVTHVAPVDRPNSVYQVRGWYEFNGKVHIRAFKTVNGQGIGLDMPEDELITIGSKVGEG